jgi:hypothetical protein
MNDCVTMAADGGVRWTRLDSVGFGWTGSDGSDWSDRSDWSEGPSGASRGGFTR